MQDNDTTPLCTTNSAATLTPATMSSTLLPVLAGLAAALAVADAGCTVTTPKCFDDTAHKTFGVGARARVDACRNLAS